MKKELWDEEQQEEISCFLENVKSRYRELLEKETRGIIENPNKTQHLKGVVEELEEIIENYEIQPYNSLEKPVCKDLECESKKENLQSFGKQEGMLQFLLKHYDKLHWEYGYNDLSEKLKEDFAFGEVIGVKAPMKPRHMTLGFVLLSRSAVYPKHVHEGVDELYLNIGGSCLINGQSVFPGESYHVASGLPHEIQAGKEEMVILLYTWLFARGTPKAYELKFIK